MGKRDGRQKGAQEHAEGQQGQKAHRRFIEQLHEGQERPEGKRAQGEGEVVEGKHRLHEGRQQYDEAEFNSEKVRTMREVERGNLDADDPAVKEKRTGHVNRR